MVTGIVLVNVERSMLQNVIDGLRKITGITEIYAVAGEYDLVLMLRVKDNVQLADIIANQLTRNNGILHTKTLISLKAYSELDLEKIFLG